MRTKSKTELPRGYLSWSQVLLVEKNPKQYVEVYIYGKKNNFKGFEFGKKVHNRLAKGIRPRGIKAPIYPETNVKMECVLARGKDKVRVIGEFDGYDPQRVVVGEYKTDTTLWTLGKATRHEQMKLYALMKYLETGKIPSAELTCLETENVLGKMKLTKRIVTHTIAYSLKDMLEMQVRVWRAYDKIIKLVDEELTKIF